MSIINIGNF